MKKQKNKICFLLVLLMLLCGCQTNRTLGERAIVKAIYLDTAENGMIEAALVVFTCTPNSDTASVEGEAKIYSATGRDIEEALRLAELKQNKKPFYAQNELFLIGPHAAKTDVTPFLSYFGQEDAARPNLGVFITPLSAQELAECEPVISNVIREGEQLMSAQSAEGSPTRSIYEIEPKANGAEGWLPVLSFSKDERTFIGVRSLLLFYGGKTYGILQESDMQLALLLAGKQNKLSLHEAVNGQQLSCETQRLSVDKTSYCKHNVPSLTVVLRGEIRQISAEGKTLEGQDAEQAVKEINEWIERRLQILHSKTFRKGNDVFSWGWWLRMCDAKTAGAMEQSGDLYKTNCITFESALSVDE